MEDKKKTIENCLKRWAKGEFLDVVFEESGIDIWEAYKIMAEDENLGELHGRARHLRAELDIDDMRRVAEFEPDIARANMRVNLAKWTASKFNRAVFGDQVDVNINQSINIQGILDKARVRLVDEIGQSEMIEATYTKRLTGCEPVDPLEATPMEALELESSDDIFS